MDEIIDIYYTLCLVYVPFLWLMFVFDNLIFLILRLLKKEPSAESKHAFSNAFMQRGSTTEVFMAVINVVSHVGFFTWLVQKFTASISG